MENKLKIDELNINKDYVLLLEKQLDDHRNTIDFLKKHYDLLVNEKKESEKSLNNKLNTYIDIIKDFSDHNQKLIDDRFQGTKEKTDKILEVLDKILKQYKLK